MKKYDVIIIGAGPSGIFCAYKLIENNKLDDFTYNKSLQKICESLRVDKDMKAIIKSMKR